MNLYRVFPWDARAAVNQPGGALFRPASSNGGFDNPDLYLGLYCARSPEAAVGERFGFLARWRSTTFAQRGLPLSLAVVVASDTLPLVDLDEVATLAAHSIRRASTIATRNRSVTQPIAARAFHRGNSAGIAWWSPYVADWSNVLLWKPGPLTLASEPEPLSPSHRAVISAAALLPRVLLDR